MAATLTGHLTRSEPPGHVRFTGRWPVKRLVKHRAMTPLRWLGRLPGRMYRNHLFRVFTLGIIAYQIAFQIAWRIAGKPDQDVMSAFTWLCVIVAYLALTVANIKLARHAKKYWHEGHDKYDLALAALTAAKHGQYKSRPVEVNGEAKHDLVCACGVYVGTVPNDRPEDAFPFIERHAEVKLKELQDEVEEKTHALHARR